MARGLDKDPRRELDGELGQKLLKNMGMAPAMAIERIAKTILENLYERDHIREDAGALFEAAGLFGYALRAYQKMHGYDRHKQGLILRMKEKLGMRREVAQMLEAGAYGGGGQYHPEMLDAALEIHKELGDGEAIERVLKSYRRRTTDLQGLFKIYAGLGREEEGYGLFQDAIAGYRKDGKREEAGHCYWELGRAYEQNGDPEKALHAYLDSADMGRDSGRVCKKVFAFIDEKPELGKGQEKRLIGLIQGLIRQGEFDKAIEYAHKAGLDIPER